MGDPRRITQELVEVEYSPPDPGPRRITQELAEVEYSPPDPGPRRITQLLVEVEYLAVPDEDQTQIRGHDQIQPWSITSDRLSQEVAGIGLGGGGPDGPLFVRTALYPQPTARGQFLASDAVSAWTLLSLGAAATVLRSDGADPAWVNPALYVPVAPVARGRILVADATPAWTSLALGAAGEIIQSDGTDPVWMDPAGALPIPPVARGDMIAADATPDWSVLTLGAAGTIIRSDGTDPAWVNPASYVPVAPGAQGQAIVSDVAPAWTASLTPTWLGTHAFSAGLSVAAAQAITMGDEAYIGAGGADVRIKFDAGNDIVLLGGYVGMGLDPPASQLDVYHAGDDTVAHFKSGDDQAGIAIEDDDTQAYIVVSNNLMQLGFVNSLSSANITTDAAGQFGIGTMIVDRLLHASLADAATNAVSYVQRLSHETSNTAIAGFGSGIEFELEENDGSERIAAIIEVKWSDAGEGANADAYFNFMTMLNDGAAASRTVVGYNGFVGAGIGTPAYMLDVYHATDDIVGHFKSNDDLASLMLEDDDAVVYVHAKDGYMSLGGQNTLHAGNLNIATATGFAGLGTVTPDKRLHVKSSGADGGVVVERGGAAQATRLEFHNEAGNFGAAMEFGGATASLLFKVGGGAPVDAVFIKATGEVGVGTPTPGQLLHVYKNGGASNLLVEADASNASVRIDRGANTNYGRLIFMTAGGADFDIGQDDDATSNFYIGDSTFANKYLTIDTSGNVGLGTAAPLGPFHVATSVGGGMFVTADNVAGGAVTIISNAAGDVTSGVSILYWLTESGGGTDANLVMVANGASVDLYDDSTDVCTLTVNADGSVTVVRTAGAATFDISMWMVWI